MIIGIPSETRPGETRVAATPETIKKLLAGGKHVVLVQSGAGVAASIPDADYQGAGASIAANAAEIYAQAEMILKVRPPQAGETAQLRSNQILVGTLNRFDAAGLEALARQGVTGFALEAAPRITRAQSLDVLSSQANLGGYIAVLAAATHYPKVMPMFMTAAGTSDRRNWRTGVGYFSPTTPMSNDTDIALLTSPRDLDKVKAAIAAAGYAGQKVVVPIATDFPTFTALGNVGVDMMKKLGLNVEVKSADWGSLQRALASAEPVEKGGWSAYFAHPSGVDFADPATHYWLRGNGRGAARGWPTSPRLEELRERWLVAPDDAARRAIASDMQHQAFVDVPYIPVGQLLGSTVYSKSLSGIPVGGGPLFWNVRKG